MPSRLQIQENVKRSRERAAEKLALIHASVYDTSTAGLSNCERLRIELIKEGLAENSFPAFQRAEHAWAMFEDKELQIVASGVAMISPFASDYIQQCPALAVMMTLNNDVKERLGRLEAIKAARHLTEQKLKLKELCLRYSILPQLRKLKPISLRPRDFTTLIALSRLNPSLVAQELPLENQVFWLSNIGVWTRRRVPIEVLEWVVTHNPKDPVDLGTHDNLADFAERVGFSPKASWVSVVRASALWHEEQAQRQISERIGLDAYVANYGPFEDVHQVPNHSSIEPKIDIQIHALKTQPALIEEHIHMKHCVDGYWRRVRLRDCLIFSIRTGDHRIATVELSPYRGGGWQLVQIKGPRNAAVPKEYTEMMLTYIRERCTPVAGAS